jgi:hypothetical protein
VVHIEGFRKRWLLVVIPSKELEEMVGLEHVQRVRIDLPAPYVGDALGVSKQVACSFEFAFAFLSIRNVSDESGKPLFAVDRGFSEGDPEGNLVALTVESGKFDPSPVQSFGPLSKISRDAFTMALVKPLGYNRQQRLVFELLGGVAQEIFDGIVGVLDGAVRIDRDDCVGRVLRQCSEPGLCCFEL